MNKIKINKRLKKLSAYLLDSKKIIDIGCDHALLGIYLCLNNKEIKVIASDINAKPLIKAKANVLKYDLSDRVKIKQADGLIGMEEDVDTVVISGMGTTTIINILKNIKDYPSVSKIVLSPNNDFELLRCEIQKLGFKIFKEEIIKDKNKYYLIIVFLKGQEITDNYFGKLDLNNKDNIEYYKYLYTKNEEIINEINNNDLVRKNILIKENKKIKKKVNFK